MLETRETRVTARCPGTNYRMTLEGRRERTTTRMLAFLRQRGFTEVETVVEPEPDALVTAEGQFRFYAKED